MPSPVSYCKKISIQKIWRVIITVLALAGCVDTKVEDRSSYIVKQSFTAVGQNERIRFLIMHYTALDDEKSLDVLTQDQVSAHYLILKNPEFEKRKPIVFQLVNNDKEAWHAGTSNWNGRVNLNGSSIGIEIVNLGFTENMLKTKRWYPYTERQIIAITALVHDLINRYQITPDNILGHSDIAPLRKQDPGVLFPWKRLAKMGIGAWPDEQTVKKYLAERSPNTPADILEVQKLLKQYGYDLMPQNGILDDDSSKIISAFQMHFRPADVSGQADAETEAIAKALIEKYRK